MILFGVDSLITCPPPPFSSCWAPAETGGGKRKEGKGATGDREGKEREGQRAGAREGTPRPGEREGKGEGEGQGAGKRQRSRPRTGEGSRTGEDEGAREGAREGEESRRQRRSQQIEVGGRTVMSSFMLSCPLNARRSIDRPGREASAGHDENVPGSSDTFSSV